MRKGTQLRRRSSAERAKVHHLSTRVHLNLLGEVDTGTPHGALTGDVEDQEVHFTRIEVDGVALAATVSAARPD